MMNHPYFWPAGSVELAQCSLGVLLLLLIPSKTTGQHHHLLMWTAEHIYLTNTGGLETDII